MFASLRTSATDEEEARDEGQRDRRSKAPVGRAREDEGKHSSIKILPLKELGWSRPQGDGPRQREKCTSHTAGCHCTHLLAAKGWWRGRPLARVWKMSLGGAWCRRGVVRVLFVVVEPRFGPLVRLWVILDWSERVSTWLALSHGGVTKRCGDPSLR